MNETGFKCPECGTTESFTANAVVLFNARVSISADGWDYWSSGGDCDLTDHADLTCDECGYEDNWKMFREEW